jgi:hypothetical protein
VHRLVLALDLLGEQPEVLMPLGNIQIHDLAVRPVQVVAERKDLLAKLVDAA